MPWDAMAWDPPIHLGLFVHRVDDIAPGLYLFVRDPTKMGSLKRAMHPRFDWSTPPGCPPDLPLCMLEAGDARRLATQLSCHQGIAGDGAFSLAMFAEYQETLFEHGAWFYRRLFWEAGMVGQVLYLEAEAAGLRAAGIDLGDLRWLFPATAVLSNLVSNVPAVMLLLPHASHPLAGPILALSSTLAGNLLIVGSIANIIVVDQAAALGVRIGWREHARVGVPVTLATLAVAAAWLALRG